MKHCMHDHYYVTTHFKMSEWTRSDIAARRGIKNDVPREMLTDLARTSVKHEEARTILDTRIFLLSGYRSWWLNATIGGSRDSSHLYALAGDSVQEGYTPRQALERLIVYRFSGFDQIILEFDRWLHISVPKIGQEPINQILIAELDKNGKVQYSSY